MLVRNSFVQSRSGRRAPGVVTDAFWKK